MLKVQQFTLETLCRLRPVVDSIAKCDRDLANQMRRAAQSVVLNIAEGQGVSSRNAKVRFATACGSVKEVRAALHVAVAWGYTEDDSKLDDRLDHIAAVTWKLTSATLSVDESPQHGADRVELTVYSVRRMGRHVTPRNCEMECRARFFAGAESGLKAGALCTSG